MQDDAIPEPIWSDERSRAQTVELCGDSHLDQRCTLLKDHAGMHECLAMHGTVRWQATFARQAKLARVR